MAEVLANGVTLHVQRLGGGDATPVVFLHGLVMDNLSSWYFTVANRVAARAPALLYDLRGHGRSERPAGGYSMADMVADLAALLDAEGADRVQLVGNSFGGQLALAFAVTHPQRVDRIALVDAHIGGSGWGDRMVDTLSLEGEERDRVIAREFASWLGRHSERKRNRLARSAEALVHGTSLLADLRSSPTLDADALARIACPVLAIYGQESDVLDDGRALADALPACELRVLPGCSHSVLWEATDTVRDALIAWSTPKPPARALTVGPGSRRYLFVVPPLAGHINPAVSVAESLRARGHRVAWVGHRTMLGRLLPADSTVFALDDEVPTDIADRASARAHATRGAERLKFLWEEFFVPLARAMRPGVEAAVDAFEPEVMIVDQQAIAGALVARKRELPWATLATTSADLVDPLAGLPKVRAWLDGLLADLSREAGLEQIAGGDRSPRRVIAFTSAELLGDVPLGDEVALVGPATARRPQPTPFPWEQLQPRKRILVSLGTVNAGAGARFYGEVATAAAQLDAQVILVAPADAVPEPPAGMIVADFVPQLALLPELDAVVCHAGHNTVVESLGHGLPLVVAPIKDDQPVIADQVVRAGAGIRVKFGRVRAAQLADAVTRVLTEPEFRRAAERIRDSLAAAGGAERAADLLEELS